MQGGCGPGTSSASPLLLGGHARNAHLLPLTTLPGSPFLLTKLLCCVRRAC